MLLHNLWRWVGSQQAAMYSQSLHLAVAALQRKMLAQLVAELTRLGATVVAANASSLILGTGKHDTASAVGQATHLSLLLPCLYCCDRLNCKEDKARWRNKSYSCAHGWLCLTDLDCLNGRH